MRRRSSARSRRERSTAASPFATRCSPTLASLCRARRSTRRSTRPATWARRRRSWTARLRRTRGAAMADEQYERGMKVRREVLGDEHVDAAIERTSPFTADYQDLIVRYAWGEIWTRPGLDRRTRSAITL